MGDTFIEQLIKRKNDSMVLLKQIGIAVLAVLILGVGGFALLLFPTFSAIILLIMAGAVYGGWLLLTSMNVEFEYIYTNGEMDVDKIMAKRKRKRVTTVRVSSFDEFEPFTLEQYRQRRYDITINAAISMQDPDAWYASYRNRDGKKCCLVFSPNENLLKEMQLQYRRKTITRQ